MKRSKKALVIASFVIVFGGASAWSLDMNETRQPVPHHDLAAWKVTLDQGDSASVEAVLSSLLDGENPRRLRQQLKSYDAHDVSSVLFHPAVVEELAQTTPDRLRAWDRIADDLEYFYFVRDAATG